MPIGRVCVIGAGPAGVSALYQYAMLGSGEKPEVTCYEKQDSWGGMWNYTWRTGTDEYGEPCHGGMYKNLWTNAPKECLELADYSWKEHFGKPMPSFLPRRTVREYLEARWSKNSSTDLMGHVKFNHVVRNVKYSPKTDDFHVIIADLKTDTVIEENFSHVVVAVGIFSTPFKPTFPGMESFQGRVIHAHDFREAQEFKSQRILVVGGSFSAEDINNPSSFTWEIGLSKPEIEIAISCMKFGAKSAICCWHSAPIGHNWPMGIQERPPIKAISQTTVTFEDDSSAEVDAIILCTGYLYKFPFMEDALRLKSHKSFYPDNLYKGVLWTKGGNNKLMYMGVQNQLFSVPMFDVQAYWIWRYFLGELKSEPKSASEMTADIQKWLTRHNSAASIHDFIEFQADYLAELIQQSGKNDVIPKARDVWHDWARARQVNIGTFRDEIYTSVYTGQKAEAEIAWMKNMDDEDIAPICNGHQKED